MKFSTEGQSLEPHVVRIVLFNIKLISADDELKNEELSSLLLLVLNVEKSCPLSNTTDEIKLPFY